MRTVEQHVWHWLSDIPDVAWAAVVTGGFLLGQNALNNRRDDKRRKDDAAERDKERIHAADEAEKERNHQASEAVAIRQHELKSAKDARQRDLEDLSRAERFTAHQEMMTLYEEADRQALDLQKRLRLSAGTDDLDRLETLADEFAQFRATQIAGALRQVKIYADRSPRSIAATTDYALGLLVQEVFAAISALRSQTEPEVRADSEGKVKKLYGQFWQQKQNYDGEARSDMGIQPWLDVDS